MSNSVLLAKPQNQRKPLELVAAPIGNNQGILVADNYIREQTYTGNLFSLTARDGAVADGDTIYFLVNVDSGHNLHIAYKVASDSEATIEVFENPTITDNGTEISAFNKNRTYPDSYNSVFYSGPTFSDTGTSIFDDDILGAQAGRTITTSDGTFAAGAEEWVFEAGKSYAMSFTNNSGTAAIFRLKATFFEEAI